MPRKSSTISKETDALQDILDDHRLEHVQLKNASEARPFLACCQTYLKLAVGTSNAHSGLVTHDLGGNHGQCLALSGVDLARHDTAAGLVLGQAQLAETAARTRSEVTNVVRYLHERASNDV